MSSVATKAQIIRECFGGKFEPDRCTCDSAASCSIMVIINCSKNVSPEDMKDSDWTAGTYEEILAKYNAGNIDDFPTAHAVDLLSIATQSDPQPMKDVPLDLLDQHQGIYLGISPLVATLQDDVFSFDIARKIIRLKLQGG